MRVACLVAGLLLLGSGPCSAVGQTLVGGMAPVVLHRVAKGDGKHREFTSVTLLPGRGLNLFQVTARLPGRGETELLRSPSVDEAARVLNGQGEDAFGNLNHSFGGAFLIPFTSRLGGELSSDKKTVQVAWRDKHWNVPNDYLGHYAVHGLVNMMKAEDIRIRKTPDGETLTAVIHAGDFGGYWLSKTDLHYTVALTADAVDVSIRAVNVGGEDEPMGMGWHPYLKIISGNRAQARVHIPAEEYTVVDTVDGRPTGELKPVDGTPKDYRSAQGALLPDASTSVNFSKLTRSGDTHRGSLDAWLADPAANYAIRVRGLSPEMRTVHLWSAKGDVFCALEEQYNFMDALGPEWKGMDTGMVALKPGSATTWHVKLEMFDPPSAP